MFKFLQKRSLYPHTLMYVQVRLVVPEPPCFKWYMLTHFCTLKTQKRSTYDLRRWSSHYHDWGRLFLGAELLKSWAYALYHIQKGRRPFPSSFFPTQIYLCQLLLTLPHNLPTHFTSIWKYLAVNFSNRPLCFCHSVVNLRLGQEYGNILFIFFSIFTTHTHTWCGLISNFITVKIFIDKLYQLFVVNTLREHNFSKMGGIYLTWILGQKYVIFWCQIMFFSSSSPFFSSFFFLLLLLLFQLR